MTQTTYIEEQYFFGSSQIIVHSGFNYVDICVLGGGGAGRRGGGGAGGIATNTYRALESEWGTFLTCSVAAAVVSAAGLPTTVNGTLNGAAITELKGFGGARGGNLLGGAGGTQSGGDATAWPNFNEDGIAGGDYDSDLGIGGAGGPSGENLFSSAGGQGYGSGGGGDPTSGGNGEGGVVFVRWRV